MQFYPDILQAQPLIEKAIQKFGHVSEHNFWYWVNWGSGYGECVFAHLPDGSGLLTIRDKSVWEVFVEPLSLPERKIVTLMEFIGHALSDAGVVKVRLELRAESRRELLRALPKDFRACRITYSLTAPMYDLAAFDPALPGGHYKELRNARNTFYRDHAVEVVDALGVERSALHILIDNWKKNRPPRDRAFPGTFHAYVDNDFRGTTSVRAFRVDGRIVGINAGWEIPNTASYYAAIGLHDYSLRDLGDIMYLEDLAFLKNAGYCTADFGGSWKKAINYKLKFGKASLYKTFVFSVVRA